MLIREAEHFNYGNGLGPWDPSVTIAAVEATAADDLDGTDFYHAHTGCGINIYRPLDAVGIETIEEDDNPGVYHTNIGCVNAGSWYRYTFDVQEAGWIKLVFRLAGPRAECAVAAYWDEQLIGIARMPGTGSWHLFEWAVLQDQIQVTTGNHILRVEVVDTDPAQEHDINFDTIGIGFNWTKPTREDIFADDFEEHTDLYNTINVDWIVDNGSGVVPAAWRLWSTTGNNLRDELPDIVSMTGNYAITDSDLEGAQSAAMDEVLVTPPIDCTNHRRVRLNFNKNFHVYPDDTDHLQIAEVDIRSSDDGVTWSDWVNLLHWDMTTVAEFETAAEEVDIAAYADHKIIQIRWHYYDATFDYWFAVDDIVVAGDREKEEPGKIIDLGYAAGVANLTWDAFGGGSYTVEFTEDLTSGDWVTVPVPGQTWPITETTWSGDIGDIFDTGGYLRVRSE